MRFDSLLASWKSRVSGSRRPQARPARHRTRLVLERFEDRSLPSSYSAATVSDLIADINAANKAGGANTITLTAPTTSPYVLTAVNNSSPVGNTGLPMIAGGQPQYGKKDNLTIVGNGDTIERSTASETLPFRLFSVVSGGSLTLQNMTLQNGYVSALGAKGGAILNGGALTLNGVTVAQNEAYVGNLRTPLAGGGGGIWSNGSLTLENGTLFQGNHAQGADGALGYVLPNPAYGGALYVAGGTANISNTTFTGNSVTGGENSEHSAGAFGGAIYVAAGQVTLTNSTVSNNSAGLFNFSAYPGYGGGLCIAGGTVTVTEDTVESNTADFGSGGGLYVAAGTVTLTNCTVEYNGATGYGGGLYSQTGATVYINPFTLANIINNTAAIDPNIDGSYILT